MHEACKSLYSTILISLFFPFPLSFDNDNLSFSTAGLFSFTSANNKLCVVQVRNTPLWHRVSINADGSIYPNFLQISEGEYEFIQKLL